MSAAHEHSITELFDRLTVGQTIQINIDHNDLSINMIGCWNSMCFSQSKGFNTEMRSQGIVADIMEQYSRHNRVDSTILLGDNHDYNDGDGTNGAKITEKDNIDAGLRCFENIYKKELNDKPVIIGNWIQDSKGKNLIADLIKELPEFESNFQ